ncbi:MAG: sugar ABC transporter substrate-binding protein [Candidatus Nanopelagicaceae bacterium]|nr:sugar ABC transporter substrate-binding protein [Candidatus Nanopelagicaceae bacterium]
MKGITRKLWAAGIAGLLVASVGLVSNPTFAASKTTINFFTFTAVPDHMTELKAMVAIFEKKNPTIHINIQSAAYDDYFTKLKTRVAGRQTPDTFELNYENFVTYAAAGTLLDLNKASAKDKTFKKTTYYGKAYDVFNLKGKQLGVPSSFSTVVMYYNKDLFKQAGVAFPTSKWDWSDEAAAAAQLKAKLPEGTYADFQPTQFWEFYKVLGQAGGKFLSADKKTALFNKQPGISALTWLVSKTQNGYTPTKAQMGTMDDGAMFKAGKLAMHHTGIWMFDAYKDVPFGWDIVVQPGGVTPGNHFFANAVVASATTKYPAQAWKWAKFMTSDPAAVKIRLAAGWEIPAISDKKALSIYLSQPVPANRAAVFEALKFPVTPPVIRQQNEMQDTVNAWLEKALSGSVSVTEALNSAAKEVNAILAKE